MSRPFFSIIIVSFNAGSELNKTIRTVLSQDFADFEIVVKDAMSTDGSTDDLPCDDRICLIRERDGGIYDGMNKALPYASGQYLYFLNCGDYLHDNSVLGAVADGIRKSGITGPGIWYGDVIEMQTGQKVLANPNMDHFAMFRYLPCHQACFYDRSLFEERGFDTAYRVRGDYEHFLWSAIVKKARTAALPVVIADYQGGGFSETETNRKVSAVEHRRITEQYFTKKELLLYRGYLLVSLQPLREKIAQNRRTAKLYDMIKNGIYSMKRKN